MCRKSSRCKWTWLAVIGAVIVCLFTAWVYIHRRLIRALLCLEPKPECPHWLPECMQGTKDDFTFQDGPGEFGADEPKPEAE